MKRSIIVQWTCSEQVEVDFPDEEMTHEEIKRIADKAARDILPGGDDSYCDDWEWDWANGQSAWDESKYFQFKPDEVAQ
jgi:hypothetical protein